MTKNLYVPAMGHGADWRHRGRWNWRKAIVDRKNMLAKGIPAPMGIEAEVAGLPTAGDVRWADRFYRRTEDNAWCLSLGQFDARCLDGLPAFYIRAPTSPAMEDPRVCRDVRRWVTAFKVCF